LLYIVVYGLFAVEVLAIGFIEEHAVWLHRLVTLCTERDMVSLVLDFSNFRAGVEFFGMLLDFITAVHIKRIAMNFKNVRSETNRPVT
jgi:hypothetical protein